ncbi:MAG: GTP cyclohydrolase I FolE [Chloroflexota bacterium]
MFDNDKIKAAVVSIIEAIGEDPQREGLSNTPIRIADMYAEIFMGINKDPREELRVGFEEGHREMVILRDIPFHSMCEHHLLPFYGVAHIGYLPDISGRVVGASKLARVVEVVSKRLQLQERMTSDIADAIMDGLKPSGVAVIVKAEHLCMIMRGIKKTGSSIVTSAIRGVFRNRPEVRNEFFTLLQNI